MSVPSIGAVAAIGGAGGVGDLGGLADVYRQQLLGAGDVAGTAGTTGVGAALETGSASGAARGADFGSMIGNGLSSVAALDGAASTKAVQAATGDLEDVHDYVMAAQKAQVATELTTTVRNKALEAFSDIMRMPL